MRIPWTLVATAAIALAGCATTAEQAARVDQEMERTIQIYGPACERLGFKQQTDPWRNCILRLVERDRYDLYYGRYYGGYPWYGGYPIYPMSTTCFRNPGFLHCSSF